ncbi:DUF305 domain-containing protein [Mycobacterium sp.]|uniref:DUF305 domain-containing protein n=1 Tax=Mycobacterium sp. TaxID=1785 RepID=UPI002B63D6EA|nr:DUF305 domain-containing protein [Mycobacterium sp.]HKP39932.1 DUF305 domain-containing protein [Mycobacterium sp.]
MLRISAVLAALVTAAVVSACAGSSSGHDEHSAEHNAADVMFAQNMIPHHQQAVDMSAMVPSHTANRELIVMAKHISADQQAEIHTLGELLEQWGEPVGHDGMGMDGMVDAATMNKLQSLEGDAFDELWLNSMIRHHQGAITMAAPEIANGENPTAVKMAKTIVDWQQIEIGRMNALLGPTE